jgi:uncharacterized SAM-binding protein YcdF (DUF218 family)
MLLICGGLVALCVVSTDFGASLLVKPLERQTAALRYPVGRNCQAIVILGDQNGTTSAPEFEGMAAPGDHVLVRMRYGARLYRETGLPILVSGGRHGNSMETEAAAMAQVMKEDFATPVRWLEEKSEDLDQQAQFVTEILKRSQVHCVVLVTSAIQMSRAARKFSKSGINTLAAPTDFTQSENPFPNSRAMRASEEAARQWLCLFGDWLSAL